MTNNITSGDISIDCKEPEKLRDFYGYLTNWEKGTLYDNSKNF